MGIFLFWPKTQTGNCFFVSKVSAPLTSARVEFWVCHFRTWKAKKKFWLQTNVFVWHNLFVIYCFKFNQQVAIAWDKCVGSWHGFKIEKLNYKPDSSELFSLWTSEPFSWHNLPARIKDNKKKKHKMFAVLKVKKWPDK